MLGGLLVDGSVIGGGVGERLAGQPAALLQTEAFTIGHTGPRRAHSQWVGDDGDVALFFAAPRTMDGPPMSIFSDDRGLVGAGTNRIG